MERYARWLVRRKVAWIVVIVTLLVTAVAGVLARGLEQDDDVLAFLPDSNPDIRAFRDINERFGSTDIALVGIPTEDPFDPVFVAKLQAVTKDLDAVEGIDSTLTLTNMSDFVADPAGGGIITSTLITAPPANDAERRALREKVMSRDHVVGMLVSEDADATLIYAFGTPGVQPREMATRIREVVRTHFPDETIYWGGGPFISTWIYETTQADMEKLTPWAILAILGIMLVAYRDLLGTVLGLVATTTGIVVTLAGMRLLELQFNIVLSAMPVILFALGSGFAIHILSNYDNQARIVGPGPEAVVRAMVAIGPGIANAGFTTIVGVLSYVVMDIRPMQVFGLASAVGLTVAMVTSLLFVPAFISLWPRPVRKVADAPWTPPTVWLAMTARQHRFPFAVVILVLTVLGLAASGRVQTRMDLRAFFDEGTEPWVAQEYLEREFGGSQFLQVEVTGDFTEPGVVRELARVSDQIALLPHVADVQSVADAVEIIADAMSGSRRIPDTSGQLGVLYRFLESDAAVSRLITDDRRHALVQIKLATSEATEMAEVTEQVRELIASSALTSYRVVDAAEEPELVKARAREIVATRVRALAHAYRVPLGPDAEARLAEALDAPSVAGFDAGAAAGKVVNTLAGFLTSEECWAPLPPEEARAVAEAVVALGPAPAEDALAGAIATATAVTPDDGLVSDLLMNLEGPLPAAWRAATASDRADALFEALGVHVPDTPAGERFRAAVASKLQDLDGGRVVVKDDGDGASKLEWRVSGMPVLYQGLEKSVDNNQIGSLLFSLLTVYPFLVLYYRSFTAGFLPMAPMFVTLAGVFGIMGTFGVHLDIGTSILAALVVGTAVDYAVPLLDLWHTEDPDESVDVAAERAVRENSHAVWTNALTVAAGFWVLTLGDARPLQNVGGLTAVAMIVAALSTFVVVPLLANKGVYRRQA